MNMHRMPPDVRDKERIFGGVLNLTQAAFLGVGFILGLGVFALFQGMLGFLPLSVIGFLGSFMVGIVFAFYQKHGLMFHVYLLRKRKFKKKNKKLLNINVRSTQSSIKKRSLMTAEELEREQLEGGN